MHWLAWYFPRLPLACFAVAPGHPFAVSRSEGGRERIDRCNEAARTLGVRAGMALAEALALAPGLAVRPRDRRREGRLLEALGGWAWRYSSHVTFDPLLVLLEVEGSLRLFGGFDRLVARMERELPEAGRPASWAAAPTPAAAALLARVVPGTRVTHREALAQRLDAVPLHRFTRNRQWLELMRGIGLATIGDCLALPRPELARRLGREPGLLLDRLLGRLPDPRPLWQPPEQFRQRLFLPHEIDRVEALRFPARRLVELLCAFLRGRDGAAQHLRWCLFHREAPATCFETGLLEPTRESGRMLELLRHRLERLALPAPVVEVELEVTQWQPFRTAPGDLFGAGEGGDDLLLERLRARLGEEAVRGVALCPDHRPERAWRFCAPLDGEGEEVSPDPSARQQPLWLLARPQPLAVRRGRPCHRGPLRLQPFLQRVETGWWEGEEAARDYYRAVNPAGERFWVYRERGSGAWFLHGVFD